MNGSRSADVDPALIGGWLAARSIARGLPLPVAEHGGWRVDTRSDAEWCRYVFAVPDSAIGAVARSIVQARVAIKLCAEDAVLRHLLPERWALAAPSWVMTADTRSSETALPKGYQARVGTRGGVLHAIVTAADGALAASGHAAEFAGVFAYDRIVTSPEHQRRGLGRAVMALLGSRRRSTESRQILVATAPGRALYTVLGWQVYAPYATALSPDPLA